MAEKWIQKADEEMEEKGTKGKFGKATPKKIAAAKKKGGVAKKEAVFAQNMKAIAAKRHGKKVSK
jgi:type III secretory pathway component EscU